MSGMGFAFRFQQILNIRRQVENRIKNDLMKANKILAMERATLDDILLCRDEHASEFNNKCLKGMPAYELQKYCGYFHFLDLKITAQKERVNDASKVVDNYRGELTNAMKSRKIMETLREKRYKEYIINENREEQKKIDETVSYRYTADQTSGGNNGSSRS